MRPPKGRNYQDGHAAMSKQCDGLDELALFEQLKADLLPSLLKDKKRGLTAKQILEKYQDVAAMKLITNMITERDAAKSTAAATQVLDRTVGKPTERRETVHKYAALSDEELDALIASSEKEE